MSGETGAERAANFVALVREQVAREIEAERDNVNWNKSAREALTVAALIARPAAARSAVYQPKNEISDRFEPR